MICIKVWGDNEHSLLQAIEKFKEQRTATRIVSDIRKHSEYEKPCIRRRKKHLKAILRKNKHKKK